jgi:hypothetical protein
LKMMRALKGSPAPGYGEVAQNFLSKLSWNLSLKDGDGMKGGDSKESQE